MKRQEAAEYLGVSVRTIDKYIAQGRLTVRYQKATRGRVAVLNLEELDAIKSEQETPLVKPRVFTNDVPSELPSRAEHPFQFPTPIHISPSSPRERDLLITEIAAKPLLTLREAATLSGLSKQFLKESIQKEKLQGSIIRGAWRIHRQHLDDFLAELCKVAI